MKQRIKPANRLSIVFIMAVVISGSILTWFSINNISNLKELTEKKILEEERELFFRLQEAIQTKLEDLTASVSGEYISPGILKDSLINIRIKNELFPFPFIVNKSGDFVFPNFIQIQETSRVRKSSDIYVSNFEKAQAEEFIHQDYTSAEKYLHYCLNNAKGGQDSAKALNVLARIYVKSNQPQKAINSYNSIISSYYSEPGPDGLPFAYFALSQLLKITDPSSSDEVLSILDSGLVKTHDGAIPLSYSTENLLARVQQWIVDSKLENNAKTVEVNNLIAEISGQIDFVNRYGIELKEFLADSEQSPEQNLVNEFRIREFSNVKHDGLLLLNTDNEFPYGFVINNEELLTSLLDSVYQLGFSHQYLIEFPDSPNPGKELDQLIFSAQLNPYLPGQEIEIKLFDENVITDFVRRRSYIYGIAVALLLLGMILGIVLILRDLSREKRLGRLQADFTSNVTHELKTPITSIYLFAESMFFDKLKSRSEEKEYLSIIMKESERLKRMINNILEYSKMEKGKKEYHFAETDLTAMIKQVIHEMTYWFDEKKLTVRAELEEKIRLTIDREKVTQALSNLLSNAIKYSDENKNINIRLFRKANLTVLEIEDEGIGIPEDQHSRIFEKFYRVGQKETESISGTGLGLTVVKEIVEAHDGKIIVDSKPGKGSKFSIILNDQIKIA